MQYHYLITMSKTKADSYEVHGEGCSHTTRLPLHLVFGNARGTSPESVKEELVLDFEGQGWTPDMVRVMPCAKNAPPVQ